MRVDLSSKKQAVAGKAEILLDVAPEVRKPALEILAIIAPDLPISPTLR
ncbi:MAG: hypothetical protein HC889_15695 [Synechococcaceae cyanobacterium SM1_2_3]|nr:hypothetical protein [Synechococcaceae cyanobacterium SM1_2_3]